MNQQFTIQYGKANGEIVKKVVSAENAYAAVRKVCKIRKIFCVTYGENNVYLVVNPYRPVVVIKYYYVA